jgi:hypothetical protein
MTPLTRVLLAWPLAAALCAAETVPPKTTIGAIDPDAAPQLVTVTAGNGISLSIRSQQPTVSQLSGGVVIGYEKVRIAADAMDFSQSLFPGTSASVLDEGRMMPGPKGPTPDRVLFDTRETQLPRIGFRGALRPATAHIHRLPPDASAPRTAHFRVLLTALGEFSGSLRIHDEWYPHEGWADHAEIDAYAQVTERGLGDWVPRTITLFGSDDPKRKAMIRRLAQPTMGPEPLKPNPAERAKNVEAEVLSSTILVTFGENGDSDIHFGADAEWAVSGDIVPAPKNPVPFKPVK